MEKERLWASSQGLPSPIVESKDAADHSYSEALKLGLTHLNECALVIGTHNERSTALATQLMSELKISLGSERVLFSQLLGMSDNLSFNLAHHGCRVAKYVPYGPIDTVMPYLGRRAEENSSIHGQIGRELGLIEREIKRRKKLQA
jgi:proline dehydrogenase